MHPLSNLQFHPTTAVLFDMDGTLVRSNIDFPTLNNNVRATIQRHNLPTPTQPDALGMLYESEDHLKNCISPMSPMSPITPQSLRAEIFAGLETLEMQFSHNAQPMLGAAELTHALMAAGIKVGIVTRNCGTVASRLLCELSITHDLLMPRESVWRVKPHPEHLLEAFRRLGVSDVSDCWMVGDHPMDVLAARNAGCRSAVVLNGTSPARFTDHVPDLMVDSPADLLVHFEAARDQDQTEHRNS